MSPASTKLHLNHLTHKSPHSTSSASMLGEEGVKARRLRRRRNGICHMRSLCRRWLRHLRHHPRAESETPCTILHIWSNAVVAWHRKAQPTLVRYAILSSEPKTDSSQRKRERGPRFVRVMAAISRNFRGGPPCSTTILTQSG